MCCTPVYPQACCAAQVCCPPIVKMQAAKRQHAAAVLLDADAKAAVAEGRPRVHLTPHGGAITLQAARPPAKQVELVNRGDAPALFTLGPPSVGTSCLETFGTTASS